MGSYIAILGLLFGAPSITDCTQDRVDAFVAAYPTMADMGWMTETDAQDWRIDADWAAALWRSDEVEDHIALLLLRPLDDDAGDLVATLLTRWPDQPLLIEAIAGRCTPERPWCGPELQQRWIAVDPHNLAPYLDLAGAAFDAGDRERGEQLLIEADRQQASYTPLGTFTAIVANAAYAHLPGAAEHGDLLVLLGLGIEMAMGFHDLGVVYSVCPDLGPAAAAACVGILERGLDANTFLQSTLSAVALQRYARERPDLVAPEVRQRAAAKAAQVKSPENPAGSFDDCPPGALVAYLHDLLAYGEIEAFRRQSPTVAPATSESRASAAPRSGREQAAGVATGQPPRLGANPGSERASHPQMDALLSWSGPALLAVLLVGLWLWVRRWR